MRDYLKYLLVSLVLLMAVTSCSDFQKLLKSDNIAGKYEMGKTLFNEEEYQKAVLLLEDIIPYYRATKENEKISYMYAFCQHALKNNLIAAHRFKSLYDTYPFGIYAEDALFYYAYCTYMESPPIELDQTTSYVTLEAIQLFINKFPESDKVESCNEFIDDLLYKIEEKAVRNAKLFYKIEDYKAAVWTLNTVLEDYPFTDQKIDLQYLMLDSYYKLASKSIESKKKERYNDVESYYLDTKEDFDKSEYAKEAEDIYNNAKTKLNK